MADEILTLIYRIQAETGAAETQLRGFQSAATQVTTEAAATGAAISRWSPQFMEAYASVQLLGRELGVPLPFALQRLIAMSGEWGEVLSALLPIAAAAFGAYAAVKLYEALEKVVDGLRGATQAEKELQTIHREMNTDMEEAARRSEDYARAAIKATNADLVAAEAAIEHWKAVLVASTRPDLLMALKTMGASLVQNAFAAIDASKTLTGLEKERFELTQRLNALLKTLGEEEDKDRKKAAAEYKRDWEERNRIARAYLLRIGDLEAQAEKDHEKLMKDEAAFDKEVKRVTFESQFRYMEIIDRQNDETARRQLDRIKREVEARAKLVNQIDQMSVRVNVAYAHMEAPIASHIARLRQNVLVAREQYRATMDHVDALRQEAQELFKGAQLQAENNRLDELAAKAKRSLKAAEEDMAVSSIAGMAGVIAGRRAQAAVEAIWDFGKGLEASAFDPWAAAQYFAAAAEMGLIAAGVGGGGKSAVGGRGGRGRASRGAAAGEGGESRAVESRERTSTGQPSIVLNIDGVISPDNMAAVMQQMGLMITKGDVFFPASTTIGPDQSYS